MLLHKFKPWLVDYEILFLFLFAVQKEKVFMGLEKPNKVCTEEQGCSTAKANKNA